VIEKIIHQIWVGPLAPPLKWMATWKQVNPDWDYVLWDNDRVFATMWKNQKHINHYTRLGKWHGVADLVRYEVLHKYGGFMPGADSECLLPIDDLFDNGHDLFACRTGGEIRDWARTDRLPMTKVPKFLSRKSDRIITPIYAAQAGNDFVRILIEGLHELEKLGTPWRTTGNVYCTQMLEICNPDIVIWPMHYFIPFHPRTIDSDVPYQYIGKDRVYARHFWGTTRKKYHEGR